MFDLGRAAAADLRALVDALEQVPSDSDARGMLDQVEALERLKCAASAAQARITSDFDDHRNDGHPTHAVSDSSLGAEIGVARHQSPHCGSRKLSLARALVDDLPATLAALARGDIDERRAEIIADGTRDLSTRIDSRRTPRFPASSATSATATCRCSSNGSSTASTRPARSVAAEWPSPAAE